MKKILLSLILGLVSLGAYDDFQECAKTDVSGTSVIFTCKFGEYYVTYTTSSKRKVENLRILYTEEQKYKYLNKKKKKYKN